MFGNMKLFLVLNRISHSFALLTREISWSALERNFIFLHTHVLFSVYYYHYIIISWKHAIAHAVSALPLTAELRS